MDITIQNKKQLVNDTFDALTECWREGQFLEIESLLHRLIDFNPQNAELIRKWTNANE